MYVLVGMVLFHLIGNRICRLIQCLKDLTFSVYNLTNRKFFLLVPQGDILSSMVYDRLHSILFFGVPQGAKLSSLIFNGLFTEALLSFSFFYECPFLRFIFFIGAWYGPVLGYINTVSKKRSNNNVKISFSL